MTKEQIVDIVKGLPSAVPFIYNERRFVPAFTFSQLGISGPDDKRFAIISSHLGKALFSNPANGGTESEWDWDAFYKAAGELKKSDEKDVFFCIDDENFYCPCLNSLFLFHHEWLPAADMSTVRIGERTALTQGEYCIRLNASDLELLSDILHSYKDSWRGVASYLLPATALEDKLSFQTDGRYEPDPSYNWSYIHSKGTERLLREKFKSKVAVLEQFIRVMFDKKPDPIVSKNVDDVITWLEGKGAFTPSKDDVRCLLSAFDVSEISLCDFCDVLTSERQADDGHMICKTCYSNMHSF